MLLWVEPNRGVLFLERAEEVSRGGLLVYSHPGWVRREPKAGVEPRWAQFFLRSETAEIEVRRVVPGPGLHGTSIELGAGVAILVRIHDLPAAGCGRIALGADLAAVSFCRRSFEDEMRAIALIV